MAASETSEHHPSFRRTYRLRRTRDTPVFLEVGQNAQSHNHQMELRHQPGHVLRSCHAPAEWFQTPAANGSVRRTAEHCGFGWAPRARAGERVASSWNHGGW